MVDNRLTAWLRPIVTLFALAGILSLSACGGGGGAVAGSPYVPPEVPPVPPTLTVLPTTITIFSGVPATLTITAGTAPYSAFSSNAAILPVTQAASATIPLLANQVNADTPVNITIQDATGQRVTIAVTVSPSLLLPASITITGNPVCTGSNATLCSGQDGTATVVVTGIGGATLAGRSVRFDVVLGTFSLIAANSTIPAQTVTVQTDQNGLAAVTLRVPQTALTQFATLRATDVASGSTVIGQFTIAQYVNGNSVLSVIPTGTTTFTGPSTTECSNGAQASFYIFGGTPPYTVQTNFPGAISLFGSPVPASGGAFTVQTNRTCFTGLTFAITDAAGRTLLTPPLVDNVFGTTAPATLAVAPPTQSGVCKTGNTFTFVATGAANGGLGAVITNPNLIASLTPVANVVNGNVNISFSGAGLGTGTYNIVVSSGSQSVTATLQCI